MTRKAPADTAFLRMLRRKVFEESLSERVIFVDTQNQIRVSVYPAEFATGELDQVRARLEGEGVLKAVVHVAADYDTAHGPFISVVDYLPDGEFYTHFTPRQDTFWSPAEDHADAIKQFRSLFGGGEEEESS